MKLVRLIVVSTLLAGTARFGSISAAGTKHLRHPVPSPTPTSTPNAPAIIAFTITTAERGARMLHAVYPHASIHVDHSANAIIVVAPPDDITSMRTIAAGIDVRNPAQAGVDTIQIHNAKPKEVISRVHLMFPRARFALAPNSTVIISAVPQDLAQIKTVVGAIDVPLAQPSLKPQYPAEAVRVRQGDPRSIGRAVARSEPGLQVSVSGPAILLAGPPDSVASAKTLIGQLDEAPQGVEYTELYRLRFVDALSVENLLTRSFRGLQIEADKSLNSLTVLATAATQQRVADAVAQLDAAPSAAQGAGVGGGSSGGVGTSEVISLKAAVPAVGGGQSTSAADIAQSVTQALAASAPDLKIIVQPNSTRLILTGSAYGITQAKALIAQLDTPEPLVELDTEVYEVDEGAQRQLGLKFPTAALSTTYSEITPASSANASGTVANQPLGLQALTRLPLSLQAQLDFLVSTNRARILEDPRITTFSGRTASIRAGETVNILTTTGGGTGTVATTQVQSFQTGVTLDITPVVNSDDYVTVTLHPSVNTEAGVSAAGVPNIQTRDTTTTVGLHAGETIVVGGLIEDSDSRTVQKIPFLGELPIIGRLFQDVGVTRSRNEVVVTVTPRIVGASNAGMNARTLELPPLPSTPAPVALPTLEAQATIPPYNGKHQPSILAVPPAAVPPHDIIPSAPAVQNTASPSSSASNSNVAPAPLPSAFAQTNTYTFGNAPANNFAAPNAPAQIFYIQVQPTVVKEGQAVTVSAITTTNVTSIALGPSTTATQTTLSPISPGKWQATFNFSSGTTSDTNSSIPYTMTATTQLGSSTSQRIPFSLLP